MATEPVASGDGQRHQAGTSDAMEVDPVHLTAEMWMEKVGELEERAKRLVAEEKEELMRGRELNIITVGATPIKSSTDVAATPITGAAAAAPPAAAEGSKAKGVE